MLLPPLFLILLLCITSVQSKCSNYLECGANAECVEWECQCKEGDYAFSVDRKHCVPKCNQDADCKSSQECVLGEKGKGCNCKQDYVQFADGTCRYVGHRVVEPENNPPPKRGTGPSCTWFGENRQTWIQFDCGANTVCEIKSTIEGTGCRCQFGHIWTSLDRETKDCEKRQCFNDNDCNRLWANSECRNSQCTCQDGADLDPSTQSCVARPTTFMPRTTAAPGNPCYLCPSNSVCENGYCRCQDGYRHVGDNCWPNSKSVGSLNLFLITVILLVRLVVW